MNIEACLLCDAATDQGGKLNILGAFDTINAQNFPFVLPACAIALRLRFLQIERGVHDFSLAFINGDGKKVVPPLDSKIKVNISDDKDSAASNIILNLQGIKFDAPGDYGIDVAIDNSIVVSLPLRLGQIKRPSSNELGL